VFPIHLPPLRERREDVDLLAEHFLAQLNKEHDTGKDFMRPALNRLRSHSWPGNVRELKNLVHRAFILADEHIGLDSRHNRVFVVTASVSQTEAFRN
jgi:DNA-binding NtrC family response regulator